MKKVAMILSMVFVGALAMNTYASTVTLANDTYITIVDNDGDKKECCKEGKTCDKCADAKTDAKSTKSECTKTKKSSCCSSKKASTTSTTTESAKEKK